MAVEYDVVVLGPPELDRDGRVLLREAVDGAPQLLGVVDHLLGYEVEVDYFEVFVGDDERYVVAVAHDVGDERVLQEVAAHVAVHALHGVGPQQHVVLLLLLELAGHIVGEEQ